MFKSLLAALVMTTTVSAATVFDPQDIRLPVGKKVSATVFINTDDQAIAGKPDVKLTGITDLGPIGGVAPGVPLFTATFTELAEVSRSATKVEWKAKTTVEDMNAVPSTMHEAQLIFSNGTTQTARFSLTTRPKAFTWIVSSGTKTVVSPPNAGFDVSVITTGDRGTNLHIDSNSLHETSNKVHIDPSWLKLCESDSKDCETTKLDIAEGTRTTFLVRLTDDVPNGNYSGSINFAVDESPDTKAIEIALSHSSPFARFLGVLLIAVGVAVSLIGGTFLRNYAASAQALLPAAHLRELAAARKKKLAGCEVLASAPQTESALEEITDLLDPKLLEDRRFVPPAFNSPFGAPTIAVDAYAAHLQEQSTRLIALGFLIDHGFCEAVKVVYDPANKAHVQARVKALKELDDLSPDKTKTLEQLSADIPLILQRYEQKLVPDDALNIAGAPERIGDRPTVEELRFHITIANSGAWLLLIIATIVTGYAVLVASNYGFGTEADLVKCFLWGLGVPIAGQQLAPSSVTAALGFRGPAT